MNQQTFNLVAGIVLVLLLYDRYIAKRASTPTAVAETQIAAVGAPSSLDEYNAINGIT